MPEGDEGTLSIKKPARVAGKNVLKGEIRD